MLYHGHLLYVICCDFMSYVVLCMACHFAMNCLQIVANSFLANLSTSATFATILVEYLLKHMEEMGCKLDVIAKLTVEFIS